MAAIRFFICALAFAFCAAASAATPYVPLEQRLSAEQLRETGLYTLSAEQLAALNRVLCTAGIRIHALAPRQRSLETLYRDAALPLAPAATA